MEKSADHESSKEMAPKNHYDPLSNTNSGETTNVDESDFQEMEAVNESLDELSSALDFFEQRTDNIIEQLKELLHSNREIRQQLAIENIASAVAESSSGKNDIDKSMKENDDAMD